MSHHVPTIESLHGRIGQEGPPSLLLNAICAQGPDSAGHPRRRGCYATARGLYARGAKSMEGYGLELGRISLEVSSHVVVPCLAGGDHLVENVTLLLSVQLS